MHIDAIHTYERSSKQQFDSQSLRVTPSLSPSLSPSHHCHQNNGWNLENNTTKQTVRAIRVNNTYAHWCYTYLWGTILATIRLTKPTSRAITVGIAIAASKILAATLKTAQQNDRESDSSKITHMHIDDIPTYERSSKQQLDSQSLQVAPSLMPWHHCHQNNGWNLENNTTKQPWEQFE